MLSIHTRLLIWLLTLFLVFTNVYLIWEYMFFSQVTIPSSLFIPLLCLLTLLYIFCIYHVGKEDVDACLLSSAKKIGFVSGSNAERVMFKPAKVPYEDPDDVAAVTMTATQHVEMNTTWTGTTHKSLTSSAD